MSESCGLSREKSVSVRDKAGMLSENVAGGDYAEKDVGRSQIGRLALKQFGDQRVVAHRSVGRGGIHGPQDACVGFQIAAFGHRKPWSHSRQRDIECVFHVRIGRKVFDRKDNPVAPPSPLPILKTDGKSSVRM